MAVRYWANGDAVEVGGDFYDAFPINDETWGLVIGDVCGTGPKAAAITGLARHTIVASAWHGADHSTVLQSLNTTLRRRNAEAFCTALYATIEIGPDATKLEFASAGHPLPVLVTAAGEVRTIGTPGRLAGLFDSIDVTVTSLAINSGDSIVFYTDGATDVAPPHGLTPTSSRSSYGPPPWVGPTRSRSQTGWRRACPRSSRSTTAETTSPSSSCASARSVPRHLGIAVSGGHRIGCPDRGGSDQKARCQR